MRLRYKNSLIETQGSRFNQCAIPFEVLTGDDTVPVSELDIFINNEWKDMKQTFKDKDIITDNYNTYFFIPTTQADKDRGFTL